MLNFWLIPVRPPDSITIFMNKIVILFCSGQKKPQVGITFWRQIFGIAENFSYICSVLLRYQDYE